MNIKKTTVVRFHVHGDFRSSPKAVDLSLVEEVSRPAVGVDVGKTHFRVSPEL